MMGQDMRNRLEDGGHTWSIVEERTVVDPKSIRVRCACGWYGTPFLPGEDADARAEGRRHAHDALLPPLGGIDIDDVTP